MCDTYGLITANGTCPFGTSWSQLYMCPTVGHVSSNGGHCAQDRWMPQTAALDPALLIRYVCTHAYVISECTDRSMCDAIVSPVLSAKSDEETSDGLDGQDASRPLSVDGKAVPGGEQAPTQGSHHAALPLTCPLCERETSQTVFINKTTVGLVCPPCKVHGELMGGLSCPMHCSESDVGQGDGEVVYSKVCQLELVPN